MDKHCYVVKYNLFEYSDSLELQKKIRAVKENNRDFYDFILLLQHNPIFTIGKQGKREEILVTDKVLKKEGITTINVGRGGKVTYHGPGQLVVYFLLDLISKKISVTDFVWKMEETIIQTIVKWGIKGERKEGYPGVWVVKNNQERKIAAIGAKASKKITSHGLALNVNTNMKHFDLIIPCGMSSMSPISMEQIIGKKIDMIDVYNIYEKKLRTVFDFNTEEISRDKLERIVNNAKN